MFLIDTSVWIAVLRDRTGAFRQSLEGIINEEQIFLSRFTQMELLQGCRDDREWTLLQTYLQDQEYIEPTPNSWVAAARIYYDLQRQGLTVRSSIDCCIAQLALDNQLILIHNDRDFETIQRVRSLNHLRFPPNS
ncbi:PIN domain nuclease [Desertifilum sp. FACHB-1129]|uniref:Twitching motility protein PilT n=2 Tax=Desertifilum tharense IPPAS B-1220 TaxID=1781255 RepID=A0A1E5QGX4_9CYAN|nr:MULTISPECIES: PIN domain nuclease [Desertifilum]MDA0209637.1 PIN domain nuclease [Cyanobacteria bacterium FC1]MBD2313047.1 PIN domain nuclease [Desertifilum sp. FACHB-1129]MBD2320907.1 PIN domain nuclease [Desertifilum sp. FACHB-866]MBD2331036.1 PIN domain nuclease [Desertifilum sp. FACHB-868]OEJ73851.1 twitching motility protein PilT [Desertifilum tharense IPPAS B-1220]